MEFGPDQNNKVKQAKFLKPAVSRGFKQNKTTKAHTQGKT